MNLKKKNVPLTFSRTSSNGRPATLTNASVMVGSGSAAAATAATAIGDV